MTTLKGQTVVLIGGSAGIGLETARLACDLGADVILTGRNPDRLEAAAADVHAGATAAFDANDPDALREFFDGAQHPRRPRARHGRRPVVRADPRPVA
jgi:short-subunit dehydrogenase involved in D-alanine esterification of teichoic acids